MKRGICIAIDGPAGSGKSTVAQRVALHFNYIYIDTGAMYRALTLKALQRGISFADTSSLTQLANETEITLIPSVEQGKNLIRVFLDNVEVTEAIRSTEVTQKVSHLAAISGVRRAMVKLQQELAAAGGVVMDGRDIGTVVLPEAELKIFLTASVNVRAKRRQLELEAKGIRVNYAELVEQIAARDCADMQREIDPLIQAPEAISLDTTDLSLNEVIERVISLSVEHGAVFLSRNEDF